MQSCGGTHMKKKRLRKHSTAKKTPYSEAMDDEKVERNWTKATRLFNRGEYSVSIVRCGTCVELVVNFAIRQELVDEHGLPLPFVDNLLKNANGLGNKYQKLYLPIMVDYEEHPSLKRLWNSHIEKINKERNAIVHSGEFRSKIIARNTLNRTYETLSELLKLYDHNVNIQPVTSKR